MALDETTGTVSIDTTHMVKDINSGSKGARLSELTGVGGEFFFVADNGGSGRELWTSDGTPDGTEMIRDIRPGEEGAIAPGGIGSHSGWFTAVEGVLFFAANDGENGYELWKSDGTASGTEMVEDIRPGPEGSRPGGLTDVGGALFFAAADSSHGLELWRSDGTAEGTFMVKDLTGDSAGSAPDGLTNVGGVLYFAGNDRVHGWELWKSDGTAGGTTLVKDIRKGSDSSFPAELTPFGDSLAFRADDGTIGAELWGSGGDSSSTRRIEDIAPGGTGSVPRHLTKLGGELFFSTNDQTHGRELWRSNGEGTEMVEDIYSGSLSSVSRIYKAGGQLFFAASDGESGSEPWVSDGTTKGTRLVTDLRSGPVGSGPRFFTEIGGKVLFSATDGLEDDKHGRELWKTVTQPLVDFELVIPAGREGSEEEPITEVMRGGEFARYYRLRNEDGGLYTASDDVTVYLKNDSTASPDKNGLVRISGSTKEDEAFSGVRGVPAESLPETVELDPVEKVRKGEQEAVIENRPAFDVKVQERKWSRTGTGTAGINAQASLVPVVVGEVPIAVLGLAGEGSAALELGLDEEPGLRINRIFEGGLGPTLEPPSYEGQLLGVGAECEARIEEKLLRGLGDAFRVGDPFSDTESARVGAVLLLDLLVHKGLLAAQLGAEFSPPFPEGNFLSWTVQRLLDDLNALRRPFWRRSSGNIGVKAGASGNCGFNFLKGASSEAKMTVGGGVGLSGGLHGFHRVMGSSQEIEKRETGFETAVELTASVELLPDFITDVGPEGDKIVNQSMKLVHKSLDPRKVATSFGMESWRAQLAVPTDRDADGNGTSDLWQLVENVGKVDVEISPIVRELEEAIKPNRIVWEPPTVPPIQFKSTEALQRKLYNGFLKVAGTLTSGVRLDYTVAQKEKGDEVGFGIPIGTQLGLGVEVNPHVKLGRLRSWTDERGVVQCFDPPEGIEAKCIVRKDPSGDREEHRPAVFWTERYPEEGFPGEESPTYKATVAKLISSLGPRLEELKRYYSSAVGQIDEETIRNAVDGFVAGLEGGLLKEGRRVGGPGAKHETRQVSLASWNPGGAAEKKRPAKAHGLEIQSIGPSHQIYPTGQELDESSTLTLEYVEDSLAAGVSETSLDIYRLDREKGQWTAMGGSVDADSNEIETEITRFTTFVIAPDRAPHAPPNLEVQPDTAGNGSVQIDWSAPEAKDLEGYHLYRSGSKGGTYARLNGSLLSKSTFIDEDVHLDSTYFYTATAVDTAGNESPRPEAVGGALRSVQGTASARVYTGDEFDFGPTGVGIRFPAVTGAGQVRVTKLEGPPEDTTGLSRVNVSAYRYVIESEEGLSVGDSTEVRLDVSTLRGVGDPDTVTVYRRPLTGVGQLMALPTAYDSTAGDLVAQTGSFGEFVLGSSDVDNPLPIEMAGFEAQLDEGRVQLTWQTASEVNNTGFQVQRRHQGIDRWRSLGFVESKASGGTTTTPVSYQFTDRVLPYEADSLFYRLRQVDADGTSKLSDRVEVALSTPDEVQLHAPFPNPAQGQATVRLALPERQTVTLRLYDVLGRRVATVQDGPMAAGRSQLSLDLSSLSSGVYLLRFESDAVTQIRKLTIVR